MRDGRLKLQFENGQVTSIWENAGLDHFYRRLFLNARRTTSRSSENLKAGINLLVFGIFWIEALSNLVLREAVINESKDSSFGNASWQILRRASLLDKIELLFVLATDSLKARYCDLLPEFKKVLDLRNRLAHFKDSDTQVTQSITCLEEVIEIMASKNDPPLIQELKPPLISAHSEVILGISSLLRRLRKVYEKRRGAKVRKVKLEQPNQGMQADAAEPRG